MRLPETVRDIRARYVARFPIPQGAPGEAIEEAVRQWSIGLAEQIAFSLPGQGWGTKRADPTRPISKDGLARLIDGRLWIWDMVTGAGTGAGRLVANPEAEDITGQVFVAVRPFDHLGVGPMVPVPPTAPQAPAVDLAPVLARLDAFEQRLGHLEAIAQAHVEDFAGLSGQIASIGAATADAVSQSLGERLDALAQQVAKKRKGSIRFAGRTVGEVEI